MLTWLLRFQDLLSDPLVQRLHVCEDLIMVGLGLRIAESMGWNEFWAMSLQTALLLVPIHAPV